MDFKFQGQKASIQEEFVKHFEDKIKQQLPPNKGDGKKQIAILCSGCYCPPHIGHYKMMEYAINEINKQDHFNFVIGIFSPVWDQYMVKKVQDVQFKLEKRKELLNQLIQQNNQKHYNLLVDDFEGRYHRFIDYPELNELYKSCLNKYNISLAYCVGSDLLKYGIDKMFSSFTDYLIVIDRDQFPVSKEKVRPNMIVVWNTPTKDLNSTQIRKEIVQSTKNHN